MKKWVVTLVEVDEANLKETGLPRDKELGCLPDRLYDAIKRVAPRALTLDTVFLLEDKEKKRLEAYLEKCALPYHEYAVGELGERCIKEGCALHGSQCIVLHLYDHAKDRQGHHVHPEAE